MAAMAALCYDLFGVIRANASVMNKMILLSMGRFLFFLRAFPTFLIQLSGIYSQIGWTGVRTFLNQVIKKAITI